MPRTSRPRPAGQRLPRHCRGRAGRPGWGRPGDRGSVSRRPPGTGPPASLCYPSRRIASRASRRAPRIVVLSRRSTHDHAYPRTPRAGDHPGHRPPDPRPRRLPDVGAALGKSIREFRKASSDVQEAVKVNVDTSPLPATPAAPQPPATAPAPSTGRQAPLRRPTPAPADPSDPTETASPARRTADHGRRRLAGRPRPTMADADALREPGVGGRPGRPTRSRSPRRPPRPATSR